MMLYHCDSVPGHRTQQTGVQWWHLLHAPVLLPPLPWRRASSLYMLLLVLPVSVPALLQTAGRVLLLLLLLPLLLLRRRQQQVAEEEQAEAKHACSA